MDQLVQSNQRTVNVTLVDHSQDLTFVDKAAVVKADPSDLVELARQVQKADEFIQSSTSSKLSIIVEQIRQLQQKALQVLMESQRDNRLHHAACNFQKVPGQTYFLYERLSGQQYFSMLSPEEWGPSCPHKFLGTYRLESDMSWTPGEKIASKSEEMEFLQKIINAQKPITDMSFALSGGQYAALEQPHSQN